MRQFVLAMICAATVGFVPTCGYGQSYGALYAQRPEPPLEPSVPQAATPANTAMAKAEPAPVQRAVAPRPIVRRPARVAAGPLSMPSPEGLVMMVRATIAAVHQANFTENYSVLHGMTTPALQSRVTANQFGAAFAGLRKQNLDLSPVLVMNPQFTATPALTPEGVLRVNGVFPSRPLQINFAIDYRPVDGFWLIESLSVSTAQAAVQTAAQPSAVPVSPVSNRTTQTGPVGLWDSNVRTLMFGPSVRWGTDRTM